MKLIATLITSLAMASAANANTSNIVIRGGLPTVVVHYGDLNMQSDAGRSTLTHRVQVAANYLCYEPEVEPLGTFIERKECYRAAIADGANQMEALLASSAATTSGGR